MLQHFHADGVVLQFRRLDSTPVVSDPGTARLGRFEVFAADGGVWMYRHRGYGAAGISGSLACTLSNASLSAAGVLAIYGQMAVTLEAASLAASGTLGTAGFGALSITLAPASLSSTGALRITGELGVTLGDVTLSGGTVSTPSGVLSVALAAATLRASGLGVGRFTSDPVHLVLRSRIDDTTRVLHRRRGKIGRTLTEG